MLTPRKTLRRFNYLCVIFGFRRIPKIATGKGYGQRGIELWSATGDRYQQKSNYGPHQDREDEPAPELPIGLRLAEHVNRRIGAMKGIGIMISARRRRRA